VSAIPHLLCVEPGVYRSGQPPPTADSISELAGLGITRAVKLNSGTDSLGPCITIQQFDLNLWDQLVEPDNDELHRAVDAIVPGTLVHCENGNDRTGLVVALYRLKRGWSKADAESEMLDNGFHKTELGLWSYWRKQNEKDWI